jgi:hypothetical protein
MYFERALKHAKLLKINFMFNLFLDPAIERSHLGNLMHIWRYMYSVNGMIYLREIDGRVWIGFICLRIGSSSRLL